MERMSVWISFVLFVVIVGAVMILVGLHSSSQTRTIHAINSLFVIVPYKYEGTWVFDDPAVGLTREPFIAGIDTIIDHAVADIPNAMRGFDAIFSASPFPGYTLKLEWRRCESGGNWY